jgi:hypothetical protein
MRLPMKSLSMMTFHNQSLINLKWMLLRQRLAWLQNMLLPRGETRIKIPRP